MRNFFNPSFSLWQRILSPLVLPFSWGFLAFLVSIVLVVSVCSSVSAAPVESKGLMMLEEIQDAISELAEHVTPTVVGVSAIRQLSSPGKIPRQNRFKVPGAGSGVVIHEDGYIVTNHHVINDSVEAEVHFFRSIDLCCQDCSAGS